MGNYLGKNSRSLRRRERRPSYAHTAAPVLGPRAVTPGVAATTDPSVDVSSTASVAAPTGRVPGLDTFPRTPFLGHLFSDTFSRTAFLGHLFSDSFSCHLLATFSRTPLLATFSRHLFPTTFSFCESSLLRTETTVPYKGRKPFPHHPFFKKLFLLSF